MFRDIHCFELFLERPVLSHSSYRALEIHVDIQHGILPFYQGRSVRVAYEKSHVEPVLRARNVFERLIYRVIPAHHELCSFECFLRELFLLLGIVVQARSQNDRWRGKLSHVL